MISPQKKYNDPVLQCHIGGRKQNQDFVAQSDVDLGKLLIACDGVGGNSGGAIASQEVALYIKNNFNDVVVGLPNIKEYLFRIVEGAHNHILSLSRQQPKLLGMATTLILVLVNSNKAYVVHVGDSRFTLIRNRKIIGATEDHSYVQQLVKKGHLTLEESIDHPRSNEISRAIGISNKAQPELNIFNLQIGDKILITTDGVHGVLTNNEITDLLIGSDANLITELIVAESNQKGAFKSNGEHDNIGVVLYTHKVSKYYFYLIPYIISLIIILIGSFLVANKMGVFDGFSDLKEKNDLPTDQPNDKEEIVDMVALTNEYKRSLTGIMEYASGIVKTEPALLEKDKNSIFKKSIKNLEEICEFENLECISLIKEPAKESIQDSITTLNNVKTLLEDTYKKLLNSKK